MKTNMTVAPGNHGWKQSIYHFHNAGRKRLGKANSCLIKALLINPHDYIVQKITKLANLIFKSMTNLLGRIYACFKGDLKIRKLDSAEVKNSKKPVVDPAPVQKIELDKFEQEDRVVPDKNKENKLFDKPIDIALQQEKTEEHNQLPAEGKQCGLIASTNPELPVVLQQEAQENSIAARSPILLGELQPIAAQAPTLDPMLVENPIMSTAIVLPDVREDVSYKGDSTQVVELDLAVGEDGNKVAADSVVPAGLTKLESIEVAPKSNSKEMPVEESIQIVKQQPKIEELNAAPAEIKQLVPNALPESDLTKVLEQAANVNSLPLVSPNFLGELLPITNQAPNTVITLPIKNPIMSTALVPQTSAGQELKLANQSLEQTALSHVQNGVVNLTKTAVALTAANECLHAGIVLQSAAGLTSVATSAGLAVQGIYLLGGGIQLMIGLETLRSLYKGDSLLTAIYNGFTAPVRGVVYATQSVQGLIQGSKEASPLALPAPNEFQPQEDSEKGFATLSPQQADELMAMLTEEQRQALRNGEKVTLP